MIRSASVMFVLALSALAVPYAHATFHLFDFTEVYSNADGSIQFIEMTASANNQHLLNGHSITSGANTFNFTANLSSSVTSNKSMLLATEGFAALQGAVTPDYIIPNNFFAIDGDTLTLVGGVYSPITWTSGGLPTDGINSLNRSINGGASTSVAANSPTNFAGATGSIDLSGGGEEPRNIFVDFSAPDGGDGTEGSPFNTFAAGVDAVPDAGTVFINAGHSNEILIVDLPKTFAVEAVGGIVTIGPLLKRSIGFQSRSNSE